MVIVGEMFISVLNTSIYNYIYTTISHYSSHIPTNVAKTILNHPPMSIFIGGMFAIPIKPFRVMGGLLHCFNHMISPLHIPA